MREDGVNTSPSHKAKARLAIGAYAKKRGERGGRETHQKGVKETHQKNGAQGVFVGSYFHQTPNT